jgi:hypothetical protein
MEIAILAAIAFAVNKTVTVLKALTSKDWRTVQTQVLVWVVGIGAILACAHADLTMDMVIPAINRSLGSLDGVSLVVLGWVLGSTGSFAFDFKKAIDSTDSAQETSLFAASPPPTV